MSSPFGVYITPCATRSWNAAQQSNLVVIKSSGSHPTYKSASQACSVSDSSVSEVSDSSVSEVTESADSGVASSERM
jgi:hypothetical protein